MLEHMISEQMTMSNKTTCHEDDRIDPYMKPVHFKPSFLDRVLSSLGNMMIRTGLKLKYRQHPSLTTERASAPNFLIML